MDERKDCSRQAVIRLLEQLIKQAVQNACQQALVYGEDVISIDHRTDFRRCKAIKEKYDETDPERLAEQMKILVSREPMGLFEGCCKGFFLVHRRKKHITINGDLPDVLQKVVLAHELGHCVLHSGSSSAAFHEVILFDTADQKEYEANVFASELLLPDEAVLEVLNDDMFFFQAAKALYVPSELLDFKFRILKRRGYKVESPITANGDFLKNLEQRTDVPAFD